MTTGEQLEYIWLVDSLVLSETGKHLDSLTRQIIEGILNNESYSNIAEKLGYDSGYIGDKARVTFKTLSKRLNEKVDKHNFCWVLERVLNVDYSLSVVNYLQTARDK
ncbi:MAG TPA: hypothetical protein V6D21_23550 [Candidatus Obscuribacterales bacterium]